MFGASSYTAVKRGLGKKGVYIFEQKNPTQDWRDRRDRRSLPESRRKKLCMEKCAAQKNRTTGHMLRHESLIKTVPEGMIEGTRKSYVGVKRKIENRDDFWTDAIYGMTV